MAHGASAAGRAPNQLRQPLCAPSCSATAAACHPVGSVHATPALNAPHEARKCLAGVLVPAGSLVDGQARVRHAVVVAVAACGVDGGQCTCSFAHVNAAEWLWHAEGCLKAPPTLPGTVAAARWQGHRRRRERRRQVSCPHAGRPNRHRMPWTPTCRKAARLLRRPREAALLAAQQGANPARHAGQRLHGGCRAAMKRSPPRPVRSSALPPTALRLAGLAGIGRGVGRLCRAP